MSSKAKQKNIKKKSNSFTETLKDNRVYLLCIFIIISVSLICLLIANRYPFGDLPAIKGDGMEQLFTKNVANISEIKKHGLPYYYNFNSGGFYSMFAYRIYDITHPWLILKYFFTGKSLILLDYTCSLFLNLIISGIMIIFYLTHRHGSRFDKQDMRLVPIALAYTFCSFNLIMFSYELFKYACFLPLLILGMEQLVYKNKKVLYICILIITMLYNPYPAFILCEFLALYFLTMHFESISAFFKSALRFIATSIISAGLAAFYLVPVYMLTKDSAYTASDQASASLSVFFRNFLSAFSDYRMFNKMDAVSSDKGQAAVYCGMIMLAVIPLFILCKRITLSERIRRTALLAILVFAFNNELFNYILHGFHFQTMVPNRFAMFFVFLLIQMLSDVILNSDEIKKSLILCCTSVPACIFIILYVINKNIPKASVAVSITFLVIYCVVSLACIVSRIKITWMFRCILFITAFEILMNCLYTFPSQMKGESIIISDSEKIDQIADRNPEMKDFYNLTEFMGSSATYYNIGNMTDISTLTFFNSDTTSGMIDRARCYNLSAGANNLNYYGGNPLANMMLGVRFHISDGPGLSPYTLYGEKDTYENLHVYENPNYISFGFVVTNKEAADISISDYGSPIEYQNSLAKALGGTDIYVDVPFDYEISPDQTEYSGKMYKSVLFRPDSDVKGNAYTYAGNEIYYVGSLNGNGQVLFFNFTLDELSDMDNKPKLVILDASALGSLHDTLSKNCMSSVEYKDNKITGSIDTAIDGTLYLSLPYSDNWKVYIDKKEVSTSEFLGGIGIPITSGSHEINIDYQIPGELAGVIISLATLLLLIGVCVINKHKK